MCYIGQECHLKLKTLYQIVKFVQNTEGATRRNLLPVPRRPWSKVGADLFVFRTNNYLILVDYTQTSLKLNS